MSPMGKKTVRWIKPEDLDERMSSSRNILAKDRFDQPVLPFRKRLCPPLVCRQVSRCGVGRKDVIQ